MLSGATDYTFAQHAARAAIFPASEKEHPKTFSFITTLISWAPGKTNPRKQPQGEKLDESFFKRFGGKIFQLYPESASIKGATLSVQDFEETILAPNVKETGYKLREYFEGIEGEDNARTVILSIDNDNIYNPGSEICKIVNLARNNISHIHYTSPLKKGQHYDRFFYYPNLTREVLE